MGEKRIPPQISWAANHHLHIILIIGHRARIAEANTTRRPSAALELSDKEAGTLSLLLQVPIKSERLRLDLRVCHHNLLEVCWKKL